MFTIIAALLATWAIGRRTDSQTQRRLVLMLTMLLVALTLLRHRIAHLFAW